MKGVDCVEVLRMADADELCWMIFRNRRDIDEYLYHLPTCNLPGVLVNRFHQQCISLTGGHNRANGEDIANSPVWTKLPVAKCRAECRP